MKKKLIRAFLAIVFCTLLCGTASAQQVKVEGLNIKLGDDVATVKTALHTNNDPEPINANPNVSAFSPNSSTVIAHANKNPDSGNTVIFLRTKGIRVFFNQKGLAYKITFNAPYEESIAGIKIGDPETKVRSLMGKPINKPMINSIFINLQYALDDTAYINFSINNTDGVQTISINK
jgi:hypothetical protein